MKSAPGIAFDVRPSRGLGCAGVAICALASAAPWLTGLPISACGLLSLLSIAIGVDALRSHWHPRFRRIAYRASGWTLIDHAGAEHAALLESHVHLGALVALGFRYAAKARFRIVLVPDNLDAETRRQLILLLARAEVVQPS